MEEIGRKMLGNIGEEVAARYLEDSGYEIVDRNYYCQQGEIDLIVRRKIQEEADGRENETGGRELVFVEVKTISNLAFGAAEYRVDRRKQARIRYTAREYLAGRMNIMRR